ncbi:metal binding domain of Ada-domain-containing protein [Aspergillus californicus]
MSPKPLPQAIPRLSKSAPSATSNSATTRWQSVVARDKTATTFVYAVLTTKIYCRPSCPSRLARRANVEFYDTPTQAERAGFRACKRCNPETLKPVINPQVLLVQKACRTIKSDLDAGVRPTLSRIAGEAGLTASHFHRVFKKVVGVTPGRYAAGLLNSNLNGHDDENCYDELVKRGPIGGSPSGFYDENRDLNPELLFQPCQLDGDLCAGLESWLDMDWDGRDRSAGIIGADIDDAVLWNDFDALIAAEAEYLSRQDSSPLAGGLGVP